MDKIDYKKMYKELYAPKTEPSLIKVPAMKFLRVKGHGNPNDPEGEYQRAVELLYGLTYTIKMGLKHGTLGMEQDIFPDYVVPPLEGLWWMEDPGDDNFTQKDKYCWYSMIRQPDFITEEIVQKAMTVTSKKKPELDVTKAEFVTFEEGLCVQCMHIGPYDNESVTIQKIEEYIASQGLINDIGSPLPGGDIRRHHEIYLADPRKVNPATMKTILRHPVRTQ